MFVERIPWLFCCLVVLQFGLLCSLGAFGVKCKLNIMLLLSYEEAKSNNKDETKIEGVTFFAKS
jgi:hypothetical protein